MRSSVAQSRTRPCILRRVSGPFHGDDASTSTFPHFRERQKRAFYEGLKCISRFVPPNDYDVATEIWASRFRGVSDDAFRARPARAGRHRSTLGLASPALGREALHLDRPSYEDMLQVDSTLTAKEESCDSAVIGTPRGLQVEGSVGSLSEIRRGSV
jgi:hypothetical protein